MQSSHERFDGLVTAELKNVVELTKAEVIKRREGDSVFVDTMSKAMAKLRHEAILNFGGGDDNDEDDEDENCGGKR
jgi:hypothetical protein